MHAELAPDTSQSIAVLWASTLYTFPNGTLAETTAVLNTNNAYM